MYLNGFIEGNLLPTYFLNKTYNEKFRRIL
nr:MAG TPA: hypothetical protein [Bacteriophage sp.]